MLQFVARVLQCSVGYRIEWGSQSVANLSMRCLPMLPRVLQCVAVRCTCVAVYCRVLIRIGLSICGEPVDEVSFLCRFVCCSVLHVCCSVLHVCCSVL